MTKKPNPNMEIKKLIKETVLATVPLVMAAPANRQKSFYQQTEVRLWAYPILQDNVNKKYPADIADLKLEQHTGKSKSIVFWSGTGGEKVSPEESQKMRIAAVEVRLAKDKEELRVLDEALSYIANDQYYPVIEQHYFGGLDVEKIADQLGTSVSTVVRNKSRLVKTLALRLYGAYALEDR